MRRSVLIGAGQRETAGGRFDPLPLALLLVAGCATAPPPPEHEYAEVAGHIALAACAGDVAAPATLPLEAELAGAHPVAFYLRIALERSPEILAAQRRVAAEAERIPQVTALDDPTLTDTFWPFPNNSLQTAAGRLPNTLSIQQRFPWLAKLRVRGEVVEQETKMALTQLAQAQLRVAQEVRLAYYDVAYYQEAIRITEENERLLQELVAFAEIRVTVGGSAQDVLRAKLELDKLREQLIVLRRQLRQSQADLAALLHASPELEPLAETPLPPLPAPETVDQLYEIAVRCRPELQQQLHAIVRDQRRRELAALQYYPDFLAGAGWSAVTANNAVAARTANGHDNFNFTVGVSLPIWRDKLRAGVREAEHRVVEAARRYDAERDDTFRQIRRLIAQIDAVEKQLTLFRQSIVPRAKQTLDVSISDYRVGKVDFLQVIDNYTEWLMFQIQVVRLEANLGQALASLERVVGCQLAATPNPAMLPAETAPPPLRIDGGPAPVAEPVNEGEFLPPARHPGPTVGSGDERAGTHTVEAAR